jgi:hypothetical protein
MEKRKKKGGCLKVVLIVIAILIVIGVIGSLVGGGDNSSNDSSSDTQGGDTTSSETQVEEEITYTPCTVNDMMATLESNALNASDTYKDQYLEVTGRLGNIDSSGDYITLYPDDEFALTGVQCYVQDDAQLEIVKTLTTDSQVTVRGICTDVGEVLGYSLDINEIVQ